MVCEMVRFKSNIARGWAWVRTGPCTAHGRGARDVIGALCLVQGALRLGALVIHFPASPFQPVNIIPSWLYGALMLVLGGALFATGGLRFRLRWPGQTVATLVAGLWLLMALDVFQVSLMSAVFALTYAAFAVREVTTYEH
jgi:hypothetical protein